MKVFGLELKDEHAELLISAVSVHSPDKFSAALSECSPEGISVTEEILSRYFQSTEILRKNETRNQRREGIACFFSVAAAPVISLFTPELVLEPIDAPRSIMLAQFAYGDKFGMDIDLARGYMVERLVTQGNTWGKPEDEYVWLGRNYQAISSVARELEKRGSVEASLIEVLLRTAPPIASGSL